MRYTEFVAAIEAHPDSALVFAFPHGRVRRGYHITEVLRAAVRSMDCGGRSSSWSEVVLQLVEPSGEGDQSWLGARKAAGILRKAAPPAPEDVDAELLLELHPSGSAAAQRFSLARVEAAEGVLEFKAEGTATQCKPAASQAAGSSACCGPRAGSPAAGCCA